MAKPSSATPQNRQSVRCAIYTRKSSEEGLDQDFNSLDAQREACAAYITSQRHEGWTLVRHEYEDGGVSGGHLNRPGLLKLLDDVKSGKVDVIVVYKVDRLTRSLSDFARIVDILDEANASFVSITQAFNTTTSMGRLTLNVLLSFAQFEREVTGERIRDKIAASKRKGLWMGGNVPLGYLVKERKLVIDPDYAPIVREIMERYVTIGSVPALVASLAADGIRTRVRTAGSGRISGGGLFGAGALYTLLANRVYLGEIIHRGVYFAGEHEPIIDQALWDQVAQTLARNRVNRSQGRNGVEQSLLAGMIGDAHGRSMTPCHSTRHGLRYRYYVSVDNDTVAKSARPRPTRVSAGEADALVQQGLQALINDHDLLMHQLCSEDAHDLERLHQRSADLASALATMPPSEMRALLQAIDTKVQVDYRSVSASCDKGLLSQQLGIAFDGRGQTRLAFLTKAQPPSFGNEKRIVIAPSQAGALPKRDLNLVTLIVKAHQARDHLLGRSQSNPAIAGSDRHHVIRMARLACLAPDIIKAIIEGRQPSSMTARSLLRVSDIPLAWNAQRAMFGF